VMLMCNSFHLLTINWLTLKMSAIFCCVILVFDFWFLIRVQKKP
jgi:hypothetical protein